MPRNFRRLDSLQRESSGLHATHREPLNAGNMTCVAPFIPASRRLSRNHVTESSRKPVRVHPIRHMTCPSRLRRTTYASRTSLRELIAVFICLLLHCGRVQHAPGPRIWQGLASKDYLRSRSGRVRQVAVTVVTSIPLHFEAGEKLRIP